MRNGQKKTLKIREIEWRNPFDFFFLLILSLYAALDLEVDEGFAHEEYHLLKLWEGRKWK